MEKLFSVMSNLQTHYHTKLYFQKSGPTYRSKWSIRGTKHRKKYQLQWKKSLLFMPQGLRPSLWK